MGKCVSEELFFLALHVDYYICREIPINPALCAPRCGFGVDRYFTADFLQSSRARKKLTALLSRLGEIGQNQLYPHLRVSYSEGKGMAGRPVKACGYKTQINGYVLGFLSVND